MQKSTALIYWMVLRSIYRNWAINQESFLDSFKQNRLYIYFNLWFKFKNEIID